MTLSKEQLLSSTLTERGSRYGTFIGHARLTQAFKNIAVDTSGWDDLTSYQKESLEMIFHKIARILNGDPNYTDSWHDIAGYASLVERILNGETI